MRSLLNLHDSFIEPFLFNGFKSQLLSALEESFIVLTVVTERNNAVWTLNGGWQTDTAERRVCELEFNDLNIHLYLTLNYGTASEHLDLDSMVL